MTLALPELFVLLRTLSGHTHHTNRLSESYSNNAGIMNYIDPKSASVGCLVGLAVGDALGAPVEFCRRDTFEPVVGMRAGGQFNLPAGAWTDDTAMALCLADSLLADSSLVCSDLLDRFIRWAEKGENSSTGVAVGIGQNTLRTLGNYRRTGAVKATRFGAKADGNGAIMRLAPVPILYWQDPLRAQQVAVEQSQATHCSSLSDEACAYLALVLTRLIAGQDWNDALAVDLAAGCSPEMQQIVGRAWEHKDRHEIQTTGYVIHTLEAALWSVAITSSFEEAVLLAVNLGDDADTVGAVTGQLAGALYGLGALPAAWLTGLRAGEAINARATALFSKSRKTFQI
ncbi:ADP-ribosylglycohydrolase family protein [Roseovarius gahaiensis]|uniref:ADP-ribosylglycohydrolase family protein n=2 Tax=Roseovarius gahaiensis TaxID=2716691 RepID=A0A967BEV9_9RHOB|nr:ADP-ribosylglycohydrolase family protein [Roseovarius gahaiensis]